MKKMFAVSLVVLACGEEKELPPPKLPVLRIDLPSGAALAPFDANRPTRPYPQGLLLAGNGKLYAALANLRTTTPCAFAECFEPGGPGILAEIDPASAAVQLVELGASCTNPGALAAQGSKVYVSCTADYVTASLGIFDTATRAAPLVVALGGGTGSVAVDEDGTVYVANTGFGGAVDCGGDGTTEFLTPGTLDVVSAAGAVLHGAASNQKVVCPASCDAQWNGVGDVRVVGGDLYVACFGSDELKRLARSDLSVKDSENVGDGPVALAPGLGGTVLVANTLGESLSVVTPAGDGSMTVQSNRVLLGVSPNDVEVRGNFAYVVNSGTATVQKIDLTTMTKVDSRTTLDRSNPFALAFEADDVVWVTSYVLGAVLKLDFAQ